METYIMQLISDLEAVYETDERVLEKAESLTIISVGRCPTRFSVGQRPTRISVWQHSTYYKTN